MGERAFGNLHEQSTIFLAAVWLHALFVDATTATTLGWAWLGFRFAYVAIWALTAGNIIMIIPAILLATTDVRHHHLAVCHRTTVTTAQLELL